MSDAPNPTGDARLHVYVCAPIKPGRPSRPSSEQHVAVLVELPAAFTDDIDGLREYRDEFDNESDFLLNTLGEPRVVRLRMEIAGEKDSCVVESWGFIREASLVDPSRGYGSEPTLTEAQLATNGHKLLREDGCEWCDEGCRDARP